MGEREAARAKRAPAKRAPVKRAPAKRAQRKRATTTRTTKGSAAHLELIRAPDPEATRAAEAKARRTSIIMLLIPTAVLTVLGLIMILSAGSISAVEGYGTSFWYFNRQLFYAVAGLVAMAVAWRLPYTAWQKLCVPMLIAILPLMLIALHPSQGTALYGASRWIDLGPVTLQPAEFLKLGLVAFAATVLANKWRKMDDLKHLVMPLAPVLGVLRVAGDHAARPGHDDRDLRFGVRVDVRRRRADALPGLDRVRQPAGRGLPGVRRGLPPHAVRGFVPEPVERPQGLGVPADPGADRARARAGGRASAWAPAARSGTTCPTPTPTSSSRSSARSWGCSVRSSCW